MGRNWGDGGAKGGGWLGEFIRVCGFVICWGLKRMFGFVYATGCGEKSLCVICDV